MMGMAIFAMTGGGTGGHVIPALAVARELRRRGHECFFIGTKRGLEAKLVPADGFSMEWIESSGLKRVGAVRTLRTLSQLPTGILKAAGVLRRRHAAAVFSTGGYVAGPVMLAAGFARLPLVVMEPNAMPGMANRRAARWVTRALVNFPEAAAFFRAGRTEVTGLPVRDEFFVIAPKPPEAELTVLVTGGSQGSRTLNLAALGSVPLFRDAGFPVRILLQSGAAQYEEIARRAAEAELPGEVVPFLDDMPSAFAQADLLVCRAGGTIAEIAAAGKPSILVPLPFAADDHQLRNAEALAKAGAARLVLDREMNGRRLFEEILNLASDREALQRMGEAVRGFARPGAARRAADVMEEVKKSCSY
jgi:UDP-N-acetylglucosamine--N-acetylmuramyl-(pentapeptide) pyrophosphoryl-undecaprenol N-acetylglucosamine transferase